MPHNPLLSDPYPITFNFPLPCNIKSNSKFSFRRAISFGAAKAFSDLLPGLYCQVNEDSIIIPANPNLAENNQFADSILFTMQKTLDAVAPLKRKKIPQKKLAPWYNDQGTMDALKQALRKLERKWRSTNLQVFFLAWNESLTSYKHALSAARSSYFSALIEEHKNNPTYLFHTVTSLTKSHASADPCILATYSSNDFMNFFDTKLIEIRETIQNLSSASAPSMGLSSP